MRACARFGPPGLPSAGLCVSHVCQQGGISPHGSAKWWCCCGGCVVVQGSGVIAVCVYGLYGSATHHWGKLATDEESGVQTAVWDSVSYVANALVFFWAGIAAVNLVARSTTFLNATAWSYAAIPIIFIFMFICRFLLILLFNPLFNLTGTCEYDLDAASMLGCLTGLGPWFCTFMLGGLGTLMGWHLHAPPCGLTLLAPIPQFMHASAALTLAQISFATVGGLRGSLSLIMTADFIINSNFLNGSPTVEENADIVLWVATFVLLTLLINAPMMSKVMEWTGLGKVTDEKVAARRQALQELEEFTKGIVRQLGEEKDEFLQGGCSPLGMWSSGDRSSKEVLVAGHWHHVAWCTSAASQGLAPF